MMFGKYSIVGSAQHVKKNENSEVMKTLWILSIFHTISNTPEIDFWAMDGDEVYSLKIVSQTRMMNSLSLRSIIHE